MEGTAQLTDQRVALGEPLPLLGLRQCAQRQIGGDGPDRSSDDRVDLGFDFFAAGAEQVFHPL